MHQAVQLCVTLSVHTGVLRTVDCTHQSLCCQISLLRRLGSQSTLCVDSPRFDKANICRIVSFNCSLSVQAETCFTRRDCACFRTVFTQAKAAQCLRLCRAYYAQLAFYSLHTTQAMLTSEADSWSQFQKHSTLHALQSALWKLFGLVCNATLAQRTVANASLMFN